MTRPYLRIILLVAAAVGLSACAGQHKRPYYACYFGEALKDKCLETQVEPDRELVCVDKSRDTHFPLPDCEEQIVKKTYSFF